MTLADAGRPQTSGLQARVSAWCAAVGLPHLSLVVFDRERVQICRYGAAASADAATPVTCLAKPLTMLLVQRAVREGRLNPAAPIETFPCRSIIDLISHTHGLDGDSIARAPLLGDGRIDAQALLAYVEGRSLLHRPGAAHSYSDFGYWLLGVVLERAYECTFGALLVECLTKTPGLNAREKLLAGAANYCPAQGCGLALSATDLASIIQNYLVKSDISTVFDPQQLAESVLPFPGWTAADNGFALGWRYHGGGWFGHSGRESLDQIVIVRFNPDAGVGMVIVSSDGRAFLLSEQIAAQLAPEQSAVARQPAPAPADLPACPKDYCGAFVNGAVRLDVRPGDAGQFILHRRANGILEQWPLRWAQNQTAFVAQPGLGAPYFVQFIGGEGGRAHQRLWTGSRVWRRLPDGQ